jgi:hypothetical protein
MTFNLQFAYRAVHLAETLDELQLVTPKDLGRNFLLHMSKNKSIKTMTPYITTRASDHEDRSIPRVCVAPSIAACIIGYDTTIQDWRDKLDGHDGKGNPVPWVGGWYLYALPFEYAIKPSAKLLPVVASSDEHWLVSYSPATHSFRPILIGKIFYSAVTFGGKGYRLGTTIDIYIELFGGVNVPFCNNLKLSPGYWRVCSSSLCGIKDFNEVNASNVVRLTKEQYDAVKMPIASTLSYSNAVSAEHIPALHW